MSSGNFQVPAILPFGSLPQTFSDLRGKSSSPACQDGLRSLQENSAILWWETPFQSGTSSRFQFDRNFVAEDDNPLRLQKIDGIYPGQYPEVM